MAEAHSLGNRRGERRQPRPASGRSEMAVAGGSRPRRRDRPPSTRRTPSPASIRPIGVDRDAEPRAEAAYGGGRFGAGGEQQLVIVAARCETRRHAGVERQDGTRRRRQRQRRQLDDRADMRGLADMAEIGEQPVGHVDHRLRDPGQRRPQVDPRLAAAGSGRSVRRDARPRAADIRRARRPARKTRRRSCPTPKSHPQPARRCDGSRRRPRPRRSRSGTAPPVRGSKPNRRRAATPRRAAGPRRARVRTPRPIPPRATPAAPSSSR